VKFTPLSANETRVELEHRNLERFGDKADDVRSKVDSPNGWGGLLKIYAEVAAKS
jgi:hypothetical protein